MYTHDARALEVEAGESWILVHVDDIARPYFRKPSQIKQKQNKRLHCMPYVTAANSVPVIGPPCPLTAVWAICASFH